MTDSNGKDIAKKEIRGLRVGQLVSILIFLAGIEGSVVYGYSNMMNALRKSRDTDNVQQAQIDVLRTDIKAVQQQVQQNSIQISILQANVKDMFFKTK